LQIVFEKDLALISILLGITNKTKGKPLSEKSIFLCLKAFINYDRPWQKQYDWGG
jgi:hypothetical protein